jgi:hypothetical protein
MKVCSEYRATSMNTLLSAPASWPFAGRVRSGKCCGRKVLVALQRAPRAIFKLFNTPESGTFQVIHARERPPFPAYSWGAARFAGFKLGYHLSLAGSVATNGMTRRIEGVEPARGIHQTLGWRMDPWRMCGERCRLRVED